MRGARLRRGGGGCESSKQLPKTQQAPSKLLFPTLPSAHPSFAASQVKPWLRFRVPPLVLCTVPGPSWR